MVVGIGLAIIFGIGLGIIVGIRLGIIVGIGLAMIEIQGHFFFLGLLHELLSVGVDFLTTQRDLKHFFEELISLSFIELIIIL